MTVSWYKEIADKWAARIAHVFLLHGNVSDTVDGINNVEDFLCRTGLCLQRDVVIKYNRSNGITFALPSQREIFYRLLGEDAPPEGDDMFPADPVGALRLIERMLLKTKEHDGYQVPAVAVIISFAESICPANDVASMTGDDRTVLVTLQRWAREPAFVDVGPPVFLLTENLTDIHPALRGASARIEAVQIPMPGLEERKEYIAALVKSQGVACESVDRVAALTAGLKRVHIEDIVLRARLENRPVDAALVKTRKDEIVRLEFAEVLEIVDPDYGFEAIGGLEYVKDFFRRNVIRPIREGNLRRVPLGVLLPGPPGTGKTAFVKAAAKESGINCASLNLSKIFNQWVGSSERNLEKALACLEALAPVMVIVDEIDQSGLSRDNSGDSGVSNRLFKRLLEFMSDTRHRGKIVFVGLTNRPDKMDPALKRPGRFDRKIPVLPPDEVERLDIFRVMFQKYAIVWEGDLAPTVNRTEGYTGAEIEALVLKALEIAEDEGSQVVKEKHLERALEAYVPTTRDIQAQVRLALQECNDKDMLPPQYRHLLDERRQKKAAPAPRTVRAL